MAIYKPSWLAWWLDGFNYHIYIPPWDVDVAIWTVAHKGDWLTLSLSIGDWIETAIDSIMGPISAAVDAVWNAIPDISTIWSSISSVWNQIWSLWDAIPGFVDWAVSGLRTTVIGWIDDVYGWASQEITNSWYNLWNYINSVRDVLDSAIAAVAGTVGDLIDSAIEDAFGDIRQAINTVLDFADDLNDLFSDPLLWLYKRFQQMIVWFW